MPSAQCTKLASGSSTDCPSTDKRYSTRGGLVGKTWRVAKPSRSKSRSVCVSIRFEMSGMIRAAKRAGVDLLAYTSVLHADTSPLGLAGEHRDTEALLRASGLPFVLLRNGWYTENYAASIPAALAHGALIGSAGEGRVASAARADYAAAAVAVLTMPQDVAGRTFELAGDEAYSLPDLAAEIARQSGRPVGYTHLPEADYRASLIGAGLPEALASLLADSDIGASKGALFDDSRQLSTLIGRPTTPMAATVAQALAQH